MKAVKAAVAALGLVEHGEGNWMFAEDRDHLAGFKMSKEPCYKLVGSIHSISLLRRDLAGLAIEAARGRKLFESSSGGALADLPNHAVVDRGSVVGL